MLRDSQGFETQIIDAVRSVNRALGGATGSTALRRSDYNQYEVQLIDAIRAIGRTLSGKGFVAGGGGGGDASGFATVQQFQDLSRRVTKLEGESFFRLVDGNVTLKSEYQNLWVPGWLSSGGIGVGGGGGGGSSYLKELLDVYHGSGGVLRADGTPVVAGDSLVYNASLGWLAAPVSGGGGGSSISITQSTSAGVQTTTFTVDNVSTVVAVKSVAFGTQASDKIPITIADTTKNVLTAHQSLAGYVPTSRQINGHALSSDVTITKGDIGLGNVENTKLSTWAGSQNITTLGTITTGTWSGTTIGVTKGGTGLTSISKGAMLYASASNTISALSANGTTTKKFLSQTSDNAPSWAVPALSDISGTDDLQAIEGLTGTSGLLKKTAANTWTLDATSYLPSGTTLDSIADGSARKLADYLPLSGGTITGNLTVNGTASFGSTVGVSDAISLVGTTAAKRRIYFGDSTHYVELDDNGFHFSHGVYSDGYVAAGGIGASGGSGSATELGDLVDVSLANRDNGDLLVYNSATSHWENRPQSSIIPSVSIGFDDLTSHPTTLAGYGITDANIANGTITIGANTITPITTETDPTVPSWAKAQSKPSYSLSEISGTSDLQAIEALTGTAGLLKKTAENTWALDTIQYLSSHQSVTLASGTNNGTLKLTTAAGAVDNIAVKGLQALAYKASLLASDIPDISGTYVTLAGAQTITGAKTFSADLTLSENLVMGAAKHIDIGPARIEYDATTGAIHVTTNQTGNNAPAIGFYADGFNAAGGIGSSGGGGGYGVESITSNQDGTVDFHFTGGDVTTVDLNHTHDGLLPEVTSSNNGQIMKVVNGAWALANESGGSGYELTSNKVTSLSSSSTDTQYPSAKCVYDIVGDVETLLAAL